MITTDQAVLDLLKSRLRRPVIGPGDQDYETARRVYNAMIDRYPAAVARAADAADVTAVVNTARETGLPLAVRGGGHNGAGLGTVDAGIVLDLSLMTAVQVDAEKRVVRVEGGSTLANLDEATHAYGLATPTGINSTTGIGGLALGGGFGHLTRKYGLTIDNMLEVEMVLADGQFVTASSRQNPDLFWAVRGGGGNFGVVTAFHFRLHPVSTVIAGPTVWPLEMTPEVMRFYRDFLREAPEDLSGVLAIYTAPAGPPFPEHLQGKKVVGIVWCYAGPQAQAESVLAPIRAMRPALDGIKPVDFPALQRMSDAIYPPGLQWYWRSDFFTELNDEVVYLHAKYGAELPTPKSRLQIFPIDGAAARVGEGETAFGHRGARFSQVIVGVDPDPGKATLIKAATVRYWEALHPYSAGGAYVNFMMDEGADRVKASYRANYERLAQVKGRYDPGNLFRLNQNVRPAGPA